MAAVFVNCSFGHRFLVLLRFVERLVDAKASRLLPS
jgi:hypothetical protein